MTTQDWLPPSDTSTFVSLHRDLTVDRIATPWNDLATCTPQESMAAVQERNAAAYDYLPVKDDGSIIGLFHARPYWDRPPQDGIVKDKMDSLSDANLIGADATILDFLTEVDMKPFRLVVSGRGIQGLVAWSDLQKLPVRTALFGLITGFELTMFDAIKRKYPVGEDWMGLLNSDRQGKVGEAMKASHESNSDIDALLYTQFCDKATILQKCYCVEGTKRLLGRIERLRNKVAHANNYVSRRHDADKACRTVKGLIALRAKILEQTKVPAANYEGPPIAL